jgi:hypothetical protein
VQFSTARLGITPMQITANQLARHYAGTRALLREYFPRADRRVIEEYVEALRVYDLFPTPEAVNRLVTAHHLITSSVPTIQIEP